MVALYNYTARESTDVSFVKGDRMEVLDDSEPDWWKVLHLTTLQEGLIPWNFVAVERSVESEEWVVQLKAYNFFISRGETWDKIFFCFVI